MVVSLLNPPNGASELKRPLHGRFGRERDKNLAAMYSMEIPQRPKICRPGCFWAVPQNFKMPVRQNIIGAAFSFEGRSGATVFLGNVNFQPRPPKPNFFIFSRTKLIARERLFRVKCIAPQAILEMHSTACNFGGGVASSVRPSGPRPSWPWSPRPHDRLLLQGCRLLQRKHQLHLLILQRRLGSSRFLLGLLRHRLFPKQCLQNFPNVCLRWM